MRSWMYRDLMGRLGSLETSDRDAAMICMLQQLPQLEMLDPGIENLLATVEFVPTTSGRPCAPQNLYDPR